MQLKENAREYGKLSLALETGATEAGGRILKVTVTDNGEKHDLFDGGGMSHATSSDEGRDARTWKSFRQTLQTKGGDLICRFSSRSGNTYVMTTPC